jgi:hypothetical protein
MKAAPSSGWIYSGKQNPCPICGRTKDGDCRISADGQRVICHLGSTHSPPDGLKPSPHPIKGLDGKHWAFTHYNDRGAHFKLDQPLAERVVMPARQAEPTREAAAQPAPITGPIRLAKERDPVEFDASNRKWRYSPTQGTKREDSERGKSFRPLHLVGNKWEAGNGPDQWPLYREDEAIKAAGFWVIETEGEKCADIVRAGGRVAISQPGHAHKVEQIVPRYRRLLDAGVLGLVYLEDNDEQGQQRSQQSKDAAAAVGLPLLVLPATEVWPGLPEKGSIDDAPGTAAERVAALEAAIPDAIQRQQQQPAAEDELSGGADGDLDGEDLEVQREALQRFQLAQQASIDLVEVFGPLWGKRLIDRAAAFPCDPQILLLPMLGFIASLIGRKAAVRVKLGWSEPLVIWGLIAQPASSLKSPAGGVFGAPLAKLQGEAAADYAKKISTFKIKEKAWKSSCKARESSASKEGTSPELPDPPLPPLPSRHYYIDSITIERLAAVHSQPNVPGLVAFHDELADWFASLEKANRQNDRPKWLKLWTGQALKHDTATGVTAFAEKTAISVVGFIQPDKLTQLHSAEAEADSDTSGDGLWARFLPVIPRTIPFVFNDLEVDITADLIELARGLDELPQDTEVTISRAAIREVFDPAWSRWAAAEGDTAPSRAAFLGKLRGYSVRIAGLLHLMDERHDLCIAMPTAITAVKLCEFFLAQFDQLCPQIQQGGDVSTAVARFLARVRDRDLKQVSARDLQNWKLLGRKSPAKKCRAFLANLAQEGIGIFEQISNKGSKVGSWVWRAP